MGNRIGLKAAVRGIVLMGVSAQLACVGHPLEPLEQVVVAAQRQETRLPAKTKLDFLFVVDNSGSMCQEQDNLSKNFSAFSQFLYQELGSAADYRIAVTSTDIQNPDHRGHFLASPAPARPSRVCTDDDGEPWVPDTADCPADLPTILASGPDGNVQSQADLDRAFRCMATLGTGGHSFEKGLEAMRLALSCNGPNADAFGTCCTEDNVYDPACVVEAGEQDPQFLRPDAVLVVIFISDENDCSEPAANPAGSRRVICKYGDADRDGDGIPDGYRDPVLCAGDPHDCFMHECGGLDATACRSERCVVSELDNSSCEWSRGNLTPVEDYRRFLSSLKGNPAEDIVVAAIVGQRAYTEAGDPITYNPGAPASPECDSGNSDFVPSAACCPDGACMGTIRTACESANGEAFAGRRYLELAEGFNENGIGCPAGTEPGGPLEGEDTCVTICTDDFSAPLKAIKDGLINILSSYCLDKQPACQAVDADGARPCETPEEYDNPAHYPIRVRQRCTRTLDQGGVCEVAEDRLLGPDEFTLILNETSCNGGALVKLNTPPQAGAEVFVEFLVDLDGRPPVMPVDGVESDGL